MEWMSIDDENMDKYVTQHLPHTENVACPHATQYIALTKLLRIDLNVVDIMNFHAKKKSDEEGILIVLYVTILFTFLPKIITIQYTNPKISCC